MLSASAPSPTPALHAYVGTYAPRGGGLHALTLAAVPPALAGLPRVADEHSPTWLCVDAARQRLHAVHELYRRPSDGHGRLSSFEILPDGGLRLLGSVDSGGCRPVHLSLHPGGRHAFVAHHDSASVAVLAVEPDGRLGAVLDVRHSAEAFAAGEAALGPAQAERAPPGSFACSGHDAPHAHMALPDPRGDIVLSTDLGLDALIAWRFDAVSGRLLSPRRVQLSPGAGPRHLVFH
ncbi:lactonase family protein, partial [Aquabacterium sp.]|uniref:lactonase family protein n=1 Tax=Aquabacterium sp. TaxID=1872578 RepID=UPI002CF9737B